jgi:hypothetical protein
MRKLVPYWYAPSYQPDADRIVEFQLKPVDQETLFAIQSSMNERGGATWPGVKAAFESGVVGWKNVDIDGAPAEFSRKNAAAILRQVGSARWMIYLGLIAGELYANAFLSDEEKKS